MCACASVHLDLDYPGSNCALIAALSGMPSGCGYTSAEGAGAAPAQHRLPVITRIYDGCLRWIREPHPPVHFFHGLIVAPARFASAFHFLNQVCIVAGDLTLISRPMLTILPSPYCLLTVSCRSLYWSTPRRWGSSCTSSTSPRRRVLAFSVGRTSRTSRKTLRGYAWGRTVG